MRATALILVVAASAPQLALTQSAWEGPRTFDASEILTAADRSGPHHSVGDRVPTEGFFYAFTLRTEFGDLETVGLTLLKKRIAETGALVALNEVSKTEVFIEAAGRSLVSLGKGAATVVTDPVGTARGLGGGIKRFGVNLGRRTQRVARNVTQDDDSEEEGTTGEAAANVATAALGVNRAARLWAQKLQVDPYSRNPVLQSALLEVAKIDAAGAIVTKVVIPIPPVVSITSTAGTLVWGQDPEALRKTNETGLKAIGVADEIADAFFRNDAFTLTEQTRFVAALEGVTANGLADYVATASEAGTPREGLFFVESVEMLQRQHSEGAVTSVLVDSRVIVALSGNRAIALLPLDYLSWTESVAQAAAEIVERAKNELGASNLEMLLTGRASGRARNELQELGWALTERAAAAGSPARRGLARSPRASLGMAAKTASRPFFVAL